MADPAELRRVTRLLETLIYAKKLKLREVERRLDMSNGTLSRIFSGRIELKFRLILDLLEILEIQPQTFFKVAYSLSEPGVIRAEETLRLVQDVVLPEPAAAAVLTRGDLEAMIAEALTKAGGSPPRSQAPRTSGSRRKPRTKPSSATE